MAGGYDGGTRADQLTDDGTSNTAGSAGDQDGAVLSSVMVTAFSVGVPGRGASAFKLLLPAVDQST